MSSMPDTYSALFWSYFVVWTFLVLFIVLIKCQISRLNKKLDELDNK